MVKVLDFGLAKLTEPAGMPSASTRKAITDSPTFTSPAMMTGVGVLLGTAAYMSPEQAKGRDADKRSDIWTFGACCTKCLRAERAFDGDDMTEVLGAVVRLEPDWQALPSDVPQPIRTLLQQCLVKDRRIRIGDIAVARFVLNHEANITAASAATAAPLPQRWSRYRAIAMAAAVGIAALMAGAVVWLVMRPTSPSVIQTTITTSGLTALTLSGSDRDVAITPDGSRVVYRGNNQLLVRALNQLEPTVLSGLGEPRGVFISPNGEWVGFFNRESRLEKVAITGRSPVMVGIVGLGGPRGATWGPDDTIIFATNVAATGLQRISAAGGQPTLLTTPDRERGEGDHLWPEFLPGGGAVLFTITPADGSIDDAQIALLDLQTRTWKPLNLIGSHAQYVPTGHLIYGVAGTLRAVPFDLERLEVRGTPKPVLEGVVTTIEGAADITLAANGSLVYVPGMGGIVPSRTVMSVDRHGNASPLPGLLPDRTATCGCRLTGRGSPWRRSQKYGRTILSAPL